MKKLVFVMSVVALLSACASSVKLDPVKVEDKSGQVVSSDAGASKQADTSGVSGGTAASTNLDKNARDQVPGDALKTVYFDYDSFVIRPEFQSTVEAHAKYLRADKARKATIEGHTDERGGREYNLSLGQKRAEAVRKALQLQGVSEAQLEAISYGKEKPAAIGNTEAAMAKNRRAEFSYR